MPKSLDLDEKWLPYVVSIQADAVEQPPNALPRPLGTMTVKSNEPEFSIIMTALNMAALARKARLEEEAEAAERATYLRLRAKYEGKVRGR
jgi:hypothetical protein